MISMEGAPPSPTIAPSEPSPKPSRSDPYAHRKGEPRSFAALWVAYVFAAIALAMGGVGMLGLVSWDVYRGITRGLMVSLVVAVFVVWPMVRLSQARPRRPRASFFADVWLVCVPVQGVIWPQCLPWMARWPWTVCAGLGLYFLGLSLLVGAVLALFFGTRDPGEDRTAVAHTPRWMLMGTLVLVAVAAPLAALLRPAGDPLDPRPPAADPLLLASPVTAVMDMVADRTHFGAAALLAPAHWWAIGLTTGLGLLAWVWVLLRTPADPPALPGRSSLG